MKRSGGGGGYGKSVWRFCGLSFWARCFAYAGPVLWLLEWVRPLISIPVLGLLGIAFSAFMKNSSVKEPTRGIRVSRKMFILLGIFLLIWTALCSSGGFYAQPVDWDKHNRILNDLIHKDWPVYYRNDNSDAMLTYYIGQYLVPAAAGKLFHSFRVGEIAMLFWNFLGVYLSVLLLLRLTKADNGKKQAFAVIVFLFFSTVLFLSRGLYAATAIGIGDLWDDPYWLSAKTRIFFRSTQNILRWIPTNGPPAWIAAALFAEQKDSSKAYLFIAIPLLLNATFPFIGLALLMLGIFGVKMVLPGTSKTERLNLLKDCMSVPNICVLPLLFTEAVYIIGNATGEKPTEIGFALINLGPNTTVYFCFCIGFTCYSAVTFQLFKREPLFYVVNGLLSLFPFFQMGLWNDLCMNASIPAIFLLMNFTIQGMFRYTTENNPQHGKAVILALLLFWGSIYPLRETIESAKTGPTWDGSARYSNIGTMSDFARRDGTVPVDMAYNYFTYDYEQSLFYRLLAKDK